MGRSCGDRHGVGQLVYEYMEGYGLQWWALGDRDPDTSGRRAAHDPY